MKSCSMISLFIFFLSSHAFAQSKNWEELTKKRFELMQGHFSILVDQCIADRFRSRQYVDKAMAALKDKSEDYINFFIDDCVKNVEAGIFVATNPVARDLVPQDEADPKALSLEALRQKVAANRKEIDDLNKNISDIEPRWVNTAPTKSCIESCKTLGLYESMAMDQSWESCRRVPDTSSKAHEINFMDGTQSDLLLDLVPYLYSSLDLLLVDELGLVKDSEPYEKMKAFLSTHQICYDIEKAEPPKFTLAKAFKDAVYRKEESVALLRSCYCSHRQDYVRFRAATKEPKPSL